MGFVVAVTHTQATCGGGSTFNTTDNLALHPKCRHTEVWLRGPTHDGPGHEDGIWRERVVGRNCLDDTDRLAMRCVIAGHVDTDAAMLHAVLQQDTRQLSSHRPTNTGTDRR